MEKIKCYLCNKPAIQNSLGNFIDLYEIKCDTCGTYQTTFDASEDIESLIGDKLYILSGISRNSNLKNHRIRITPDNCNELIENAILPHTPLEMIDRLLIYMENSSHTFDEPITLKPGDYPLVFAKNDKEFVFLLSKAVELGYIKKTAQQKYIIEMKGWDRLTTLNKNQIESNLVFVAMWFHKVTEKLRDTIRYVVNEAKYDAIIADESDYTGNIMDFILGSIKQSKFVIADFTTMPEEVRWGKNKVKAGVRGGVYYEAGFAKGLGLEVIQLCKDDEESKKRLHFDILQENTIFWKDEDLVTTEIRPLSSRFSEIYSRNFSEKLYDRIMNLFGPGNKKKQ